MEENVFEARLVMGLLTDEYVELQKTFGEVINEITQIYDVSTERRFALGGEFAYCMSRIVWMSICANLVFLDVSRLQNLVASKTVAAANASTAMELLATKIRLKHVEGLIVAYEEAISTAILETREALIKYSTMDGTVEVNEHITAGVDSIIDAINTYVRCDMLTSMTEKSFIELTETITAEYGESIEIFWSVASQFYGNYTSISAILKRPKAGSIH